MPVARIPSSFSAISLSTDTASSVLRRKKDIRKGIPFNVMICGAAGTGKSTFIRTLCDGRDPVVPMRTTRKSLSSVLEEKNSSNKLTRITSQEDLLNVPTPLYYKADSFYAAKVNEEPGINITETKYMLNDEDGSKLDLTIVEAPGFGDNVDNESCFKELIKYLHDQFDELLVEETMVRRNPRFHDKRIHVILYFIEATGHELRELDISFLKQLKAYSNIIPIISKADSFTPTELGEFKKTILEQLDELNIPFYNFPYDEEVDDEDTIEENMALRALLPFSVVSSDQFYKIGEEVVRAREYPWGLVQVDNPEHNDFVYLKSVLFGSHLQDLKDLTHDFYYENYRSEKLVNMTGNDEEDESTPTLSKQISFNVDFNNGDSSPVESRNRSKTNVSSAVSENPESVVSDETKGSQGISKRQIINISNTLPYQLKHEQLKSQQEKLKEIEAKLKAEYELETKQMEEKRNEIRRRQQELDQLKKEQGINYFQRQRLDPGNDQGGSLEASTTEGSTETTKATENGPYYKLKLSEDNPRMSTASSIYPDNIPNAYQ